MYVGAVGHDVNAISRNSASLENVCDRSRDGDDRRGTPVLPACAYVGAQREIDTTRNNHRDSRAERRDGGHGHGVRCVRVYKVDCAFSNCLPQPPRGSRIHLGRWTARDDLEPGGRRALGQRLAEPRRHRGSAPTSRKLTCEPQRLALTAAPASLCVDVHHAESHGAQHPPADVPTQGAE
jgi:hypothetical protein